jgi:hypothetical protein
MSDSILPTKPSDEFPDLPLSGLGGNADSVEYHALARDLDEPGFWGWIDRNGATLADWLNPILVKEARQSLKSRQFLITFFLLLAASCFWTVLGVFANAPDVYYVPTGEYLMSGYYLVLAIPLIGMVPLAAHRSLAAEMDDDTFEMLVITKLSSMRIVMGKLNSAMLQMLVYFAAIVPCIAFSYLLRGVNRHWNRVLHRIDRHSVRIAASDSGTKSNWSDICAARRVGNDLLRRDDLLWILCSGNSVWIRWIG